jgi:hypothetical protein
VTLLTAAAAANERDAALALLRWGALERAGDEDRSDAERRFRRRAYQRSRDRALIGLAMRSQSPSPAARTPARWRRQPDQARAA